MCIRDRLEAARIDGAKGCVINITGGKDMTLEDMTSASEIIYDVVDQEANIIVGAVVDEAMEGEIQVTVIATGFELPSKKHLGMLTMF